MEGGNKNNINLESTLDISSSDMLVPVSQPTFQHNWQRFQGKCLPNSLRFEKNGWAAGWNVYNFEYNTFRKQLAENVWAQLININSYAKKLALYETKDSLKELSSIIVIPKNILVTDNVALNGNNITGVLNGKVFSLTWDPGTQTLTMDTDGFSMVQKENSNYTRTVTVSDDEDSISLDFDLYTVTDLTGDSIVDTKFTESDGTEYVWGRFEYNIGTNTMVTPENVTVTPVLSDNNMLTFDYETSVTDEAIDISYILEKYYPRFDNIQFKDNSNEQMQVGDNPSLKFEWDKYYATSDKASLVAEDEDGVVVDWKLPLWATCGFTVKRTDPNATLCNNTHGYEIAVSVGYGLNTKVKWVNVYSSEYDGEQALLDNYRKKSSYVQYITGMTKRFNQILVGNTIEAASGWSPFKYTVNTGDVWYKSSRQYANLRGKKTALMTKYLGNVYTWGPFTFKATSFFAQNNPWNWSDSANCVYTTDDISDILSIRLKTDTDNTDTGSDEQFIEDNLTITTAIIASLTGATTEYTASQAALTYDELYSSGTYIGSTYETVGTDDTDEGFWPFEKVPKFNFKRQTGVDPTTGDPVYETIEGVYWTDGTEVIDDYDEFREKVLGDYDADVEAKNSCLIENPNYKRTRLIKQYKAGYDFAFKTEEDFSNQNDYAAWKENFDSVWEKYYPDYTSPTDAFDPGNNYDDITYMSFDDVEVMTDVKPAISYVNPGVYLFDVYAVQFGTSSGLIMYDSDSSFSTEPFLYHQSKDKKDDYSLLVQHEKGYATAVIDYQYYSAELPNYFGSATSETLVTGVGSSSRFSVLNRRANLTSAALTLGVNYNVRVERHETDSGHYYTYTWTPKTPAAKNWFGNVLVSYRKGKIEVSEASLNDGVEQVANYYCVGDVNDGIKFAWPIWGHSATRVVYPEMRKLSDINGDNAFVIEPVPTADIADTSKVYWDRNDTDKSVLLFKVKENSKQPDDSQGSGNIVFIIENADADSCLFYAKKKVDDKNNEITYKYYIPGIAWGNINDTSGNMTALTTNYPALKLVWVPKIYKIPVSANASYSVKNSFGSSHVYFSNDKTLINPVIVLGDFDAENMVKKMSLVVNGVSVPFMYDITNQKTVYDAGNVVVLDNTDVDKLTVTDITGQDTVANVSMLLDLIFKNNKARYYKSSDPNITINSASGSLVNLKKGSLIIKYDYIQQKAISPKVDLKVTSINNGQHLNIEGKSELVFTVALTNVIDNKVTVDTYEVDLSEFEDRDEGVRVISTDIRDNKDKVIAYIKDDAARPLYQLVRQQWNTTVEVENFWWVDEKHVLELNQSHFVLKRKTDELDDWNGDRFEKVYEVLRSDVLPTNILRYFVTNAYNDGHAAMLVTLQETDNKIKVTLLDIREKFEQVAEFYLSVRNRNIGDQLNDISVYGNTAYLNTYNPLTNSQVLTKAEWSNTVTDGRLILGIHLSNNFDQWAVVYDFENNVIEYCIQGYGYVGLHGDLTGGQIPDDYFDETKGFSGVVQPLSVLEPLEEKDLNNIDKGYLTSKDEINIIDPKVVGTGEQQWYIQLKLYGIVSHLTFKNGGFTKQLLPMTNNYISVYRSPSFSSATLGDNMVQGSLFASILSFDGALGATWNAVCAILGEPTLFSLAPRLCSFIYLQQTLGQYAYVHYNSSKSPPEKEIGNDATDSGLGNEKKKITDPVLSSSFLFDKQKFLQYKCIEFDPTLQVIILIMVSFAQTLQTSTNEKLSLNEEQNQSAVSDVGRKFLDNVSDNVSDMLVSNITNNSRLSQSCTSTITGMKSLDMFYSTSDQQRVMAGPGFVEHQFVADCVAQSSTSLQVEGKAYQLYMCIRGLTTYQIETEIALEEIAVENLRELATSMDGSAVCGTTFGPAIAAGLNAAATALEYAMAAQKNALGFIEKFFDVYCENGITCSLDAQVSRHSLSVEGKHKYGEKNEVFMWPCWGINPGELKYTDEHVECGTRNTPWFLSLQASRAYTSAILKPLTFVPLVYDYPKLSEAQGTLSDLYQVGYGGKYSQDAADTVNSKAAYIYTAGTLSHDVPFFQAACYGAAEERTLPDDMAKVEGVNRFLPEQPFKNENIGMSEPVFAPSLFQDYKIDENWDLGMCCTYGLMQWVTVSDTKVTNCPPSNMVVKSDFCGLATPYSAIEVKRGLSKAYMRPWAITPNTLAFNATGYNTILDNKLYHSFDGLSYRIVDLIGSPGMNKNRQTFFYSFQVNDRFKRSNKFPANEMQGNFESEPVQSLSTIDKLYTLMTIAAKEKGMEAGTVGEDKDLTRWAIPVFTEPVTTLPAAVKTMTAMPLVVVEGITGLVTDLGNNQTAYKAPLSVDFTIGKNVYRQTEEYICSVQTQNGVDIVTDLVPSLGLKYIGATPTEAYFYSKATRCYYMFSGSNLVKMDMMERFRDIQKGYWDFVNQEVVMPCLMTFKRLNPEVEDKDTETDNIIVPQLSKGQVTGEVIPPITTIFNDRSWYKAVSLPSGFAYQGPNRVIINRSVFCEYMLESLKDNLGKWKKMDREKYVTKREYPEVYKDIVTDVNGVDGWTYNPFLLVTSALGIDENIDCLFEWTITFCWPIEMDLIYGVDNYACVNIMAETMTPGGKQKSRPTHIFLTKELFTRNGNYGYYSFRFQSKNGTGNRERLFIWSDQYIAVSKLDCEVKSVTSRRTEQLTQQLDVQKLKEL